MGNIMKCRALKDGNVVWFGSYGKNADGTAKFYNSSDKHISYSDEQQSVADALTQKLSVIKGELWYRVNYGLPLFERIKSKAYLDTVVIDIITGHEDVTQINSFKSQIIDKHYTCNAEIQSKYGVINFQI